MLKFQLFNSIRDETLPTWQYSFQHSLNMGFPSRGECSWL